MIKKLLNPIFLFVVLFLTTSLQANKDEVHVKNNVFEVHYSQKLEQPIWLIYHSKNRPTTVNRGSMDFYTEPNIKTSDNFDYKNNQWDKGHLAPAASFSDNIENLKQTFSYLNCALQNQDLNRGEWRLLEEQERVWDDKENLVIKIDLIFDEKSQKLATGATVPTFLVKHINFTKSTSWKCYKFENVKPTKKWAEHQINCKH
jgi:DNA/RNA endonuclease G (NUC1)